MAKAIPCRLILHGSFKQHFGGEFKSKSDAKQYLTEIGWDRPHTIVPLVKKEEPKKLTYFERQQKINEENAMNGFDACLGNPAY